MTDALEYACFAILYDNGQVVPCDQEVWESFRLSHPKGKEIRKDQMEEWTITTSFSGVSTVEDGPPCFWTVTGEHPLLDKPVQHAFLSQEAASLAHAVAVCQLRMAKLIGQARAALFGTA